MFPIGYIMQNKINANAGFGRNVLGLILFYLRQPTKNNQRSYRVAGLNVCFTLQGIFVIAV